MIASQFILYFTSNEFDFVQESFQTLFRFVPRIVAASMIAYLISQHLDVYIFDKIKIKTSGRLLWLRNNGSTFLSQALDSLVFTIIAFYGAFENNVLWQIMFFTYLVKLIVAVIDTPFIYISKWKILKPLDKS